jgi:hypothetical protein
MVERDFPDELVRIREPVRRELDITATVFELERAGAREPTCGANRKNRGGITHRGGAIFP